MHPREWRAVGLTAGLLCLLSLWARLPAPWRWPSAATALVVVALFLGARALVRKRRRTPPPRRSKPHPEPSRNEARRGAGVAHPYPARDAIRLVERTGADLPANFRR